MNLPESESLDHILVRQKDLLLRWINNCQYERALWTLFTLDELWIKAGYAYKGRELCDRAISRLSDEESSEEVDKHLVNFRSQRGRYDD